MDGQNEVVGPDNSNNKPKIRFFFIAIIGIFILVVMLAAGLAVWQNTQSTQPQPALEFGVKAESDSVVITGAVVFKDEDRLVLDTDKGQELLFKLPKDQEILRLTGDDEYINWQQVDVRDIVSVTVKREGRKLPGVYLIASQLEGELATPSAQSNK